ncbi:MAG TPA: hypothetical protein VGG69_09445 [Rhizomicrobium sp.]
MTDHRLLAAAVSSAIGILWLAPAYAQMGGPSISGASTPGQSTSQGQLQQQQDSDRLYRDAISSKRMALQKKQSTEQSLQEATEAAKALQLSCDIRDVQLAAQGKVDSNGKKIDSKTYEIACANGMGYLVLWQNPQPPIASSCFALEGMRAAALAKGQKFEEGCVLPGNRDLNKMATAVMHNAGASCSATRVAWFGQIEAKHTEYTEVACADGKGYLLGTALPGSPMQAAVIACADAAASNMKCELTKTTAAVGSANGNPTMGDLKAALAQHGVACTLASDNDLHLIGKQNKSQRHVVEFKCPEHPKGLVALIPLGNNLNPFQSMDCAEAKRIGVTCKLTIE